VPPQLQIVSPHLQLVPPQLQLVPSQLQLVPPHVQLVPSQLQLVPPHLQLVPPHVQLVPSQLQLVPPQLQLVPPHVQLVPSQLQLVPPHVQLVPSQLQLVPPHLQLVPWLKIRAAVRRLPHPSLSRSALLGTDNFYLLLHAVSKTNILHSFLASAFLGAFAKLRKTAIGFVMSVRPHRTTQFPLDGFP